MIRIVGDPSVVPVDGRPGRDRHSSDAPSAPFSTLLGGRSIADGASDGRRDEGAALDDQPAPGISAERTDRPSGPDPSDQTMLPPGDRQTALRGVDQAMMVAAPNAPEEMPFALSTPNRVVATRFDAGGLLGGHCSAAAEPHENGASPAEAMANDPVASRARLVTTFSPITLGAVPSGASPLVSDKAGFGHGPAIMPRATVRAPETPPPALTTDTPLGVSDAEEEVGQLVSETPTAGRLAERLRNTAAALNPILVALHEIDGGHRVLARLGALDPEELEQLRSGIAALLASHGIRASDVTIALPLASSN